MVPPIRDLLLGSRFERRLDLLVAVSAGALTFAFYAAGVFAVEGGVILLPGDATLVGVLLAATVGYRRSGLLGAWLAPFAVYLGFAADWAVLGLSARPAIDRLAFLLDPTGLAVYGLAAVVLGTAAYAVGAGTAWLTGRIARGVAGS
jgi:hypothetical protein